MGKIERKNIFDLYKLRLKMYKVKQIMMLIIPVTFCMEIDWILSLLVYNFDQENRDVIFDYVGLSGKFAIALPIIFIVVMTYTSSFYKGYVNSYPCNSKTIYLSHFLAMNTIGILWLSQCMINMVLGYGVAKLIEHYNDKLVIVDEMVVKNVLLFFIAGIMLIVFIICIMQLISTIFRKSILASVIIIALFVSVFIWQKNNIIFDIAKAVINFYCVENNICLYICKILITSVVCFSAGFWLEVNVKDRKIDNKAISAVLFGIVLMAAIMGISYITFENVNTYDDNPVETKRYQLNISNDVKISIDDDIENQMMIHGYTVSASDNGETKPYVEIVRHAPEIPKDNVKDIYEDLEFDVYIKNNKLYIKSKRKNKMYLILSNDVFLGNYTNIFNHNINSYNTDVENYCFSSYEVNVYLPEKNIEQEESVGWD